MRRGRVVSSMARDRTGVASGGPVAPLPAPALSWPLDAVRLRGCLPALATTLRMGAGAHLGRSPAGGHEAARTRRVHRSRPAVRRDRPLRLDQWRCVLSRRARLLGLPPDQRCLRGRNSRVLQDAAPRGGVRPRPRRPRWLRSSTPTWAAGVVPPARWAPARARKRASFANDVYGRFSLAYATETRREVVEALSACDGLSYVGSLEVVGHGRFLQEATRAKVCLDLPGETATSATGSSSTSASACAWSRFAMALASTFRSVTGSRSPTRPTCARAGRALPPLRPRRRSARGDRGDASAGVLRSLTPPRPARGLLPL